MSEVSYKQIQSPIGPLTLSATTAGLCGIEFGAVQEVLPALEGWTKKRLGMASLVQDEEHPILRAAAGQMEEYFHGRRADFDVPLDLKGTPFQIQVWEALTRIPYGEVRSYKQIAESVGSPKAVRAVGGANNRNPVPVIVPCHRVIGAGGDMVGYGGGLDLKRFLLRHEGFCLE